MAKIFFLIIENSLMKKSESTTGRMRHPPPSQRQLDTTKKGKLSILPSLITSERESPEKLPQALNHKEAR